MSTLLHVICPNCKTKLQVNCPDADQASARCQCGHTFTFKVPTSARSAPAAPATSASDAFANLPASPPPGGATNVSAPAKFQQRPAFTNPGTAKRKNKAQKKTTAGAHYAGAKRPAASKPKWVIPVVAVSSFLVVIALGVGGWMIFAKEGSLLPPSIAAAFDSHQSVWDDANAIDLRVAEFVDQYLANPAAMKDNEELAKIRRESMHLVARAAILDPLSPSEASGELGGGGEGATMGPLTEAQREAIYDKLYEPGNNQRSFILSAIGTVLAQNDFSREFLKHGHVELADSTVAGEQVMIDQIRLLRRFNSMAAEIAVREYGQNQSIKSQPEFKAYVDKLYEPLFEPTTQITEQLELLASRRYAVPKEHVGDSKKYNEIVYYVNQARAQVLPHGLSMLQSKATLVEYVGKMRSAISEIDRAAAGIKPKLVAQADAEKEQHEAERQQHEKDRQDRIASERKAQEDKIAAEKKASEPESKSVASNQPSGPGGAFGGRSGRPPFGDGAPTGRGNPFGPRSGNQGGGMQGPTTEGRIFPQPGGPSRNFGGGRPQPPAIDTTTGVTITMRGAGSIQPGTNTQKLSQALGCAVNWNSSGGQITVKLAYTGSLDDVVKHIEFGKVQSIDKATRTITLTP